MQRVSTFALLATVALACVAHAAAQAAATTASPPAEVEAPAPSAQRSAAFLAANVTSPDALVSRVENGTLPAVNATGQLTCHFTLVGAGLSTPVDVTSLDPATQATALESAVISCTGSASNATIQGGPALADFTGNFSGSHNSILIGCASDHSLQTQLPKATDAFGCTRDVASLRDLLGLAQTTVFKLAPCLCLHYSACVLAWPYAKGCSPACCAKHLKLDWICMLP